MEDSLVLMPLELWSTVQEAFEKDFPRGISGYTLLEVQRELTHKGLEYGFKVYCPFGDPSNGIVAVKEKDRFCEIVILCPKDDTKNLENALKSTTLIDWSRRILVPYAPGNIMECLKKIMNFVNVEIESILMCDTIIMYRDQNPGNVSLTPPLTFEPLNLDQAEFINSKWPHRYPGSVQYFHLLIKAGLGFGLFENQTLISWVFINEGGTLGHLYTVEEHRKKGYGEVLLKLVCNIILNEKQCVFGYCVKGNDAAYKLYRKYGLQNYGDVGCYILVPKN